MRSLHYGQREEGDTSTYLRLDTWITELVDPIVISKDLCSFVDQSVENCTDET